MASISEYFKKLDEKLSAEIKIAEEARRKGFDPETFPEISIAGDLAERVEGITKIKGIAEKIKKIYVEDRIALAFKLAEEICNEEKTDDLEKLEKVIDKALRASVAVLTEGVLVAPTEGISQVKIQKNSDGTPYLAIYYAGPIRGAGGTAAAVSVLLGDFIRKKVNLFPFKISDTEVERYIEEINIYNTKAAHLQYKPSDSDLRIIVKNLEVCVDGSPTDEIEVSGYRNIVHYDRNLKPIRVTNRIRGGIALVLCEGIAQKASKVLKISKKVGMNWEWLNQIIKVKKTSEEKEGPVFLEELVAGRPIFSYPEYPGGFRLRYGRSRLNGIAAKSIHPAAMHLLGFTAVGTQMKVEKPGKGCIITPCDTIEGPMVRLKSGEVLRIKSVEEAKKLEKDVEKILSLGDILVTYGDFLKSNTPLVPSSYVEEFWLQEVKQKDSGEYSRLKKEIKAREISFDEAFEISQRLKVPMYPRYIYDYDLLSIDELFQLRNSLKADGDVLTAPIESKPLLEKALIPHKLNPEKTGVVISGEDAKALKATLRIGEEIGGILESQSSALENAKSALDVVNAVSPFAVRKRSYFLGARMGRPEKAKERMMKPAPNVLFPTNTIGNKERILSKTQSVKIEVASYYCPECKDYSIFPKCMKCGSRAVLLRRCENCGYTGPEEVCPKCGFQTTGYRAMSVNLEKMFKEILKSMNEREIEVKGVKGLIGKDKVPEIIQKGILRAKHKLYVFKDGTCRFDSTDAPMTHFYPKEVNVSVEKLKEMGYTHDYMGNPLERDDQLVELFPQDIVVNVKGMEFLLKVAKFVDEELQKVYNLPPYYNAKSIDDLIGQLVITLSPHTSTGVLSRVVGYSDAQVGFAHPYLVCARRRNCDGDEDSMMLLLDALLNFSKKYLPSSTGGSMDAPIVMTKWLNPKEVDDEVYSMEALDEYPLEFYMKTLQQENPSAVDIPIVEKLLNDEEARFHISFTTDVSPEAIKDSPKRSLYTFLTTMDEKINKQFELYEKLSSINIKDATERLILSHFLPDIIGNLHSFAKQEFRCVVCNARYRRPPLIGVCPNDGGKLLLTIPEGGINKYLDIALKIAKKYNVRPSLIQRLELVKNEITTNFQDEKKKQFSLANFI